MGDVIHATARAIAMVRERITHEATIRGIPPSVRACDALVSVLDTELGCWFGADQAVLLIEGSPRRSRLPTCVDCPRLLDEALDPTFERDNRAAAAWCGVAAALREETEP